MGEIEMSQISESSTDRVLVRLPGRAEINSAGAIRRRRGIDATLAIGFPVLLLALWQLSSTVGWIDSRLYPAPTDIIRDGWELIKDGTLWPDIKITTMRVFYGFVIGAFVGVVVGLVMGSIRWIRKMLESTLDALYVVPKLALLPILLNIFGLGEGPKIALVATTVFFFVWISTMSAVISVPEGYREAAQCFGANRWDMFRHVLMPASLPQIFVAMRVGAGIAFLVIVAAEFIVGTDGLGYLIFNSRALFLNGHMFVGIVVVAIGGVIFTEIVRFIGRRLTKWAPHDGAATNA
ncbi:ABC transporter permease [Nocardia sp. NBC_01329]|uniref:ABC transporter permease n=1 Tax=Nocardia sp. NBC_01329 TaxID=2903594 RepID=UPI002E0E6C86|nr:ABC transporter permease [Nocardia sp. NBC_01329]